MLRIEDAVLLVIDFQGKLARVVDASEQVIRNAAMMIAGAKALHLPIICTEQNPAGLGGTIDQIATLLTEPPIAKMTFSCCRQEQFMRVLGDLGRKQILIIGIETHVCVYQTAVDLMEAGLEVQIVSDAVSSRSPTNKQVALARLQRAGAAITSVEMALFELLGTARHPGFKDLLRIVK